MNLIIDAEALEIRTLSDNEVGEVKSYNTYIKKEMVQFLKDSREVGLASDARLHIENETDIDYFYNENQIEILDNIDFIDFDFSDESMPITTLINDVVYDKKTYSMIVLITCEENDFEVSFEESSDYKSLVKAINKKTNWDLKLYNEDMAMIEVEDEYLGDSEELIFLKKEIIDKVDELLMDLPDRLIAEKNSQAALKELGETLDVRRQARAL